MTSAWLSGCTGQPPDGEWVGMFGGQVKRFMRLYYAERRAGLIQGASGRIKASHSFE